MQNVNANKDSRSKANEKNSMAGPSFYEVTYLQQLREELEAFLRSKNFSTIQQFDIAFSGSDYSGHMRIGA